MPKRQRVLVELQGNHTCTNDIEQLMCRKGTGLHQIFGFDPANGDRAAFDIFGQWNDAMFLGSAYDGMVIDLPEGDFLVEQTINGTRISAGPDAIELIGWAPNAIFGWMIQGG